MRSHGIGIVNESYGEPGTRFLFHFGAYGCTHVLVVCTENRYRPASLEDALESAAGWLADHAPGIFSPPDYKNAAEDLGPEYVKAWNTPYAERTDEETEMCEKVVEEAETDHTYTESGWLLSWEWTVTEDPTREQILDLQRRDYVMCGDVACVLP